MVVEAGEFESHLVNMGITLTAFPYTVQSVPASHIDSSASRRSRRVVVACCSHCCRFDFGFSLHGG